MFLVNAVNPEMEHINIGTAGLVALTGYLVVFIGLVLLMIVVIIVGKIMTASQKKKALAAAPAAAPVAAAAPAGKPAPGSAGEVKLYDVPDKEAAMLMAIVADKMQKPVNELRFKSIKVVK